MTEYKPDVDEAIERFRQQRDAMTDALIQCMREIGTLFGPVFQAFEEAARTMYAGLWEEYLNRGPRMIALQRDLPAGWTS